MGEWKEYKLEELCEILDYKRIPLSSGQRQKRKGAYPYYGAQGIIDYVDDYLFDGVYLLVAEDGNNVLTQKENIAIIATGKYWVNNHAHVLGYNGKCDLYLLGYILNSMDISGYVTGSAQPKLNQANLVNIEIKIPTLEEQNRIVSILKSLDDKIENNRRINENLEQQAQALFKSWFVDFEPFKDEKFVESELGLIPDGWRVGTLDEICSFISRGLTPKYDDSTNEFILGQTCVRNNIVTLTNARKHLPKSKTEKWVNQWDVLINSTGIGSLGRVGVVYFDKDNVAIDSHLTVVRVDDPILRHYVGRNLLSRQIEIENMAVGSTGQTELPRDSVKAMLIILPPIDLLEKFNSIIEPMALKMYRNIDESERLSQLRDTLLPKLMSGEIVIE
ncbi:MAG: restriction endonuclease subunit S [Prevotella sp.]|nr:restriction endonuclease subunit S [Prevotella sp.]